MEREEKMKLLEEMKKLEKETYFTLYEDGDFVIQYDFDHQMYVFKRKADRSYYVSMPHIHKLIEKLIDYTYGDAKRVEEIIRVITDQWIKVYGDFDDNINFTKVEIKQEIAPYRW